jgi:gamma-butyrobetaine dioxygenase
MGVELLDCGLVIVIGGESPAVEERRYYFNYLWLRDNCATSWSPVTRDRVFDVFSQPEDLRPADARLDGSTLIVEWGFDGHVSRYDVNWLVDWSTSPGEDDPASVTQQRWFADHRLGRFTHQGVIDDLALRERFMRSLLADGAILVEGVPDTDAGITELAETIGIVRSTFSGVYFDVMAKPDPMGIAYTAEALEPHTDSPCEDTPPGIQLLHCRVNTTTGGESTLVDGAAVAEELRSTHPDDFDILASTSIPFRFQHRGLDMRARQRVIEVDDRGVVTGVTISQHMAGVFDLDQELLDRFYPAFCRFGRLLREPRFVVRFTLRAGDCMIFDNHRIVHGRLAYDKRTGERHLRGCYTDRGELRSKYRTLLRDSQRADPREPAAS